MSWEDPANNIYNMCYTLYSTVQTSCLPTVFSNVSSSDVDTSLLEGWGEWRVGQITGAADWFQLR